MSTAYKIYIEGHLDPSWSAWLDGMIITRLGDGNTLLQGQVADQAALHGIFNRIRDMNLKLLCVMRQEESKGDCPPPESTGG